jgi:hypothetical protein
MIKKAKILVSAKLPQLGAGPLSLIIYVRILARMELQ